MDLIQSGLESKVQPPLSKNEIACASQEKQELYDTLSLKDIFTNRTKSYMHDRQSDL